MNSKSPKQPSQHITTCSRLNLHKKSRAIKLSKHSTRPLSTFPPNSSPQHGHYDSNATRNTRMQGKQGQNDAIPPWMTQPPISPPSSIDFNSPLPTQSPYPPKYQHNHQQTPSNSQFAQHSPNPSQTSPTHSQSSQSAPQPPRHDPTDVSFLRNRVQQQKQRIDELEAMQTDLKMDLNDIHPSSQTPNMDPNLQTHVREDMMRFANRLKQYEENAPNSARSQFANSTLNGHNRLLNQHNLQYSKQGTGQTVEQNGPKSAQNQHGKNIKNPTQRSLSNSQFTFSDLNPLKSMSQQQQDLSQGDQNDAENVQNGKKPQKRSFWGKIRQLSPVIDQLPIQIRHIMRIAKHVKSPETLELLRGQLKQSASLLFNEHNYKRTKMEIKDRIDFIDKYIDRKLREPYIDPTTEYRLQRKEILHDHIIDAHYARDRFVDKFRAKMNVFTKTFDAINQDPRKREILARKILFTSLDNDTLFAKTLKMFYFPFGLVLRSIGSLLSSVLFMVEVATSKLVPEIALISRSLRNSLADQLLTPNNLLQLIGLTLLATFFATLGHDFLALYIESFTTPRGMFVDIGHAFLFVNSEEMMYDAIRELVAHRLLITPSTYQELFDHRSNIDRYVPKWGTAERQSQQMSLIQPIFTKMKAHLTDIYKSRFFIPFEKFTDSLRTHQLSMGFTIEALDGLLDTMYMRDTRTRPGLATDYAETHTKIVNYLLSQDFLVLPPADVIRTNAPNEIFHHVVQNFRVLEGKDPILGGELFKDYLQIGSRLAYRKKLLCELEQLTEIRKLIENSRFPNVTIPQRDIKKIACDPDDPITKAVQGHLEELRLADPVTPLYPNRAARQLLESTYQIDARHTHYSLDRTVVNDHYLMLCNMDNQRYTYDTLCNHHRLQFKNGSQRDTFEKHLYHLGLVLNKLDAIMVQNYLELRRIEGQLITPLNPIQGNNILGVIASEKDLKNMQFPTFDSQMNPSVIMPLPAEMQTNPDGSRDLTAVIDPIDYHRNNYQTLIHARKEEIKQKMDQSHPNHTVSWSNYLTDWWYGKKTTENPYSQELETIIEWQATREVMNEINHNPLLHSRFMTDFAQDTLDDLHQKGYLGEKINVNDLPFDKSTLPIQTGAHKPSILSPGYENLPRIQRLFSPMPIGQEVVPDQVVLGDYKPPTPAYHIDPYMNNPPTHQNQNRY